MGVREVARGFCGIGIYYGKKSANIGTLMRSGFCYGVDFLFTIGHRYKPQCSDTPKSWRSVPMFQFMDFVDFKNHLPLEAQLVAIEQHPLAHDLNTHFVHPERAVYLLGAEDNGIPESVLAQCKTIVQIPHVAMCLNVATAGSTILFDRFSKQNKLASDKASVLG